MSKEKRFVIQVDPLEIEDDAIFDNKELRLYECQSDMMSDICSLLNQQDHRIAELEEQLNNSEQVCLICHKDQENEQLKKYIAELEEQLKNAIVPKFEYGQIVWCVFYPNKYREGFIFNEEFVGYTKDKIICRITENEEFDFNEVFATKEEAQAKLEELKGETNVKD